MHGNRGHWDSYISFDKCWIFARYYHARKGDWTDFCGLWHRNYIPPQETKEMATLRSPRYGPICWRPPPPTARALLRLPHETGNYLSSNDDYVDDIINVQDREQMTFCNTPAVKSLRERPYIWETCKWSSRSYAISYRYCTCVLHLFNSYLQFKYVA